jgi:hypothetical protein
VKAHVAKAVAARSAMTPPAAVREAARRGLALYAAGYGGKGLRPETVAWARRVARGGTVTPDKAVKGRAWHARHAVDRRPGWSDPPTPGYVANLLWFGAPGKAWFERVARAAGR